MIKTNELLIRLLISSASVPRAAYHRLQAKNKRKKETTGGLAIKSNKSYVIKWKEWIKIW